MPHSSDTSFTFSSSWWSIFLCLHITFCKADPNTSSQDHQNWPHCDQLSCGFGRWRLFRCLVQLEKFNWEPLKFCKYKIPCKLILNSLNAGVIKWIFHFKTILTYQLHFSHCIFLGFFMKPPLFLCCQSIKCMPYGGVYCISGWCCLEQVILWLGDGIFKMCYAVMYFSISLSG